MTYETIDEIIADIGKSNLTPKQLIQAAYDLGAGIEVEEVEEVEETEDDHRLDGAFEEELDTSTPN